MRIVDGIATGFSKYKDGGNWTAVSLLKELEGVTWTMATTSLYGCNDIATLVFHINYYVKGVLDFFNNGKLEIKDKFSFDRPDIQTEEEWQDFLKQIYADMDLFVEKVKTLEDEILHQTFVDEKYGNYYRNLVGIIEHGYYHLGQVVILKKILVAQAKSKDL